MGTRVAFRPRARNAAFEEGGGVSYLARRIKFVEGTTGTPTGDQVKVGDGTRFPLSVTADQLLECHYRVRDSKFTQGELTINDFGDDLTFKVDTSTRATNLLHATGTGLSDNVNVLRGYCAFSNDVSPNQPLPDVGATYFDSVYYYTNSLVDLAARDITDDERGLWIGRTRPAIYWDNAPIMSGPAFGQAASYKPPYRTGFNQSFENGDGDAVYGLTYGVWTDVNGVEVQSEASVNFFERAAFVDNDGSGNPFSSANDLYAEFEFAAALGDGFGGLAGYIGTDTSNFLGTATSATINMVVRLSGGTEISCPIYYDEGALSGLGGYTLGTTTDFKIEADEWWPYAKTDGTDKWNSATGVYVT